MSPAAFMARAVFRSAVIKRDVIHMVDAAEDIVRLVGLDQLPGIGNRAGIGFGFKTDKNLDLIGVSRLQPPPFGKIAVESVGHGCGVQAGGPLFGVQIAVADRRHVLADCPPRQTLCRYRPG